MSRLLGSLLPLVPLATLAQTGTVAPRNISPTDTDPGYYVRKARMAGVQRAVPAALPTRPAGPQALPSCFEPTDSINSPANGGFTALPREDDNSVGPINLVFGFKLFGTVYTQCFINNNGNLTFDNALETYSSAGFPNTTPIVSAFWGDVDTRNLGSGRVWYKVYPDRLVVTWNRVNYYTNPASNTPLKNTFQLIIRANTGPTPPSPDVTFAYGDMQWTTGNASPNGNTGGFGGVPATVGVNQGSTSNNYIQTGRFNQNNDTPPQASYPAGTTVFSGVNWLDNRCIDYTIAPSGNLPPTATGFPAGNTLTLNVGQTVNLALQFAGPEIGQTVTVTPDLTGLCNSSAPVGTGGSPIVNFSVTGAACNLGSHTVTFFAQDNGTPVASQTFSLTVIVNALVNGQWTGAVNTVYTLPGNWSSGAVPGAADNVTIPAGVPNFPVLTTTAAATDFAVANGASMTIGSGGELSLSGNITNNGTFQGPNGALRATGGAAQTFGGNGITLGELTVGAAGVGQGAPLNIVKLLILNGNLTTNGQPFRLLSDASGTAMVVNNGAAAVNGNASVQRYIGPSANAGPGYRHLTAPVQGAAIGAVAVGGQFNTAYNTTGNTVTPFPTVFRYDQSRVTTSGNAGAADFDSGWLVPDASEAMLPGRGYSVNMPAGLTVNFTPGPLTNGAVTLSGLACGAEQTSGWHLLGNPYPAPIDWNQVATRTSGLNNAVYVFQSSSQYGGSYASYVNGVGPARFIGLGQGFFVRTTTPGTPGSMALDNGVRVTSYQNVPVQRNGAPVADQRPQLRLDLTAGPNPTPAAAYVYFEAGATPGFDPAYDAYFLPGGRPLALATGAADLALSINGLPALTTLGAAVPLRVVLPGAGSFALQAGELRNFGASTSLFLEDRQTGVWHDLRQPSALTFQAAQAAEATTRFVLHVNQARPLATAAALPPEAVSLWPNPASGAVNLRVAALPTTPAALELTLLNMLGQVVLRQTVAVQAGRAAATLDVHTLAPGVYVLRGATATHTFARSVVVQ